MPAKTHVINVHLTRDSTNETTPTSQSTLERSNVTFNTNNTAYSPPRRSFTYFSPRNHSFTDDSHQSIWSRESNWTKESGITIMSHDPFSWLDSILYHDRDVGAFMDEKMKGVDDYLKSLKTPCEIWLESSANNKCLRTDLLSNSHRKPTLRPIEEIVGERKSRSEVPGKGEKRMRSLSPATQRLLDQALHRLGPPNKEALEQQENLSRHNTANVAFANAASSSTKSSPLSSPTRENGTESGGQGKTYAKYPPPTRPQTTPQDPAADLKNSRNRKVHAPNPRKKNKSRHYHILLPQGNNGNQKMFDDRSTRVPLQRTRANQKAVLL